MQNKIETMMINEIEFVRKDSISKAAVNTDGLEYCIVRTYSAGVFAGYVKNRVGREVTVINARRLWKWSGAASLSQLAMEGVTNPDGCKFPCEVDVVLLLEVIEIIPCTNVAFENIKKVPVWEK